MQQCAYMGDQCQYYNHDAETGNCMLCYAGSSVQAAGDWEYHPVRAAPVGKWVDAEAVDPWANSSSLSTTGGVLQFSLSENSTCAPGYTAVESREHCELAVSHFNWTFQSNIVNSLEECEPAAYPCGCSLRRQDSTLPAQGLGLGATWKPHSCECQSELQTSVQPGAICVRTLSDVREFDDTWRRCSHKCTHSAECSHWAWDRSAKICALLVSGSQVTAPFMAPFGDNWFGGAKLDARHETHEYLVDVLQARVYTGLHTHADVAHVHQQMLKQAQTINYAVNLTRDLLRDSNSASAVELFTLDDSGSLSQADVGSDWVLRPVLQPKLLKFENTEVATDCAQTTQTADPYQEALSHWADAGAEQRVGSSTALLSNLTISSWVYLPEGSDCVSLSVAGADLGKLGAVSLCGSVLVSTSSWQQDFLTVLYPGHWTHLAAVLSPGLAELYVDGVMHESRSVAVSGLDGARLVVGATETGFHLSDSALFGRALSRAELQAVIDYDRDECTYRVSRQPGQPTVLNNPHADVHITVHEDSTVQPDRSALDDAESFQWTLGDCEPQEMLQGEVVAFQAIYETNVFGVFNTDIRSGVFLDRWLAEGLELQRHRLGVPGQTLDALPQWQLVESQGSDKWLLRSYPGGQHSMSVEFERDVDSTYPDVYRLHVRPEQLSGVRVSLASNASVQMLCADCLSCYGNCSGEAFSLVKHSVDDASLVAGALVDNYDPIGEPVIMPVKFANGSETLSMDSTLCPEGGAAFVAQYTGRCLCQSDVLRFSACEQCEQRCWQMTAAKGINTTAQFTVAFDDSGLRPHDSVAYIPKSERSLFLRPDTVTDVDFEASLPEVGASPVPVRLYHRSSNQVVRFRHCTANSGSLVVECEHACVGSTPEAPNGHCDAPGFAQQLACSPSCFPALDERDQSISALQADLEVVHQTTGVQLRLRQWASGIDDRKCVEVTPEHIQLRPCAPVGEQIFALQDAPGSQSNGNHKSALVRYKQQGCIGTVDGVLRITSCAEAVLAVHTMRDDGVATGGQAVLQYSDSLNNVTVYWHPSGTVQAVVSLSGSKPVSLVDHMLDWTPGSTKYLVRVGLYQSNESFVLVRNGTLVDHQHRAPGTLATQPGSVVHRSNSFHPDSTEFTGHLSNVDVRSYRHTELLRVADAEQRFGSGDRWRVHRSQRVQVFSNARLCAQHCAQSSNCSAARWSDYARTCELLRHCTSIQKVCEGQPNSFNLRPEVCRLYAPQLLSVEPDRLVQLVDRPNSSSTLMRLDATIESTLLGDSGPFSTTARRLMAASNVIHDHLGTELAYPQHSSNDPTDAVLQRLYAHADFPQKIEVVEDSSTDVLCNGAHSFALAGVLESTEAHYGYRQVFSAASEGGAGGLQLILSPEGTLLDRRSGVAIHTGGVSGCVSVLIIDCQEGMRVSLNGRVVYTLPHCPYVLDNTETMVRGWQGRREAICLGGSNGLNEQRHLELFAYLQQKHASNGDAMCWTGPPEQLRSAQLFKALPLDRATAAPHPDTVTWTMHHNVPYTSAAMECQADELCTRSVAMYKFYNVSQQANPFHLVQVDAITKQHIPSFLDTRLWTANVTLQQEKNACGIADAVTASVTDTQACSCAPENFEVVEVVTQGEYNNCGQCEVVQEHDSHVLFTPLVNFSRHTGRRVNQPHLGQPATYDQLLIRKPISPYTGCADIEDQLQKRVRDIPCPPCPRDCQFKPVTAATLASAATLPRHVHTVSCELDHQGCCATVTDCSQHPPTSLTLRRDVHLREEDQGRDCVQVHHDDMAQIATVDPLQQFIDTADWRKQRQVYHADRAYATHHPTLNAIVYQLMQREVFHGEWDWVSPHISQLLPNATITAPPPCKATFCYNVPWEHRHDLHTWSTSTILATCGLLLLYAAAIVLPLVCFA